MKHRCLCECHHGSVTDRRRVDGVDVADTTETAVACPTCIDTHCPALRNTTLPVDDPQPDDEPLRAVAIVDGKRYVYDNGEFRPPAPWNGEEGG